MTDQVTGPSIGPQTSLFSDRRAGEFSFREHLELVRLRPGMYGLDGSCNSFVIYLCGYDAGTRDTALQGFREWLELKLGHKTNVVWPSIIINLVIPGPARLSYRALTPEQSATATTALFRLLSEFLHDRDTDRDGLRRIHSAHTARFGR